MRSCKLDEQIRVGESIDKKAAYDNVLDVIKIIIVIVTKM